MNMIIYTPEQLRQRYIFRREKSRIRNLKNELDQILTSVETAITLYNIQARPLTEYQNFHETAAWLKLTDQANTVNIIKTQYINFCEKYYRTSLTNTVCRINNLTLQIAHLNMAFEIVKTEHDKEIFNDLRENHFAKFCEMFTYQ